MCESALLSFIAKEKDSCLEILVEYSLLSNAIRKNNYLIWLSKSTEGNLYSKLQETNFRTEDKRNVLRIK